MRHKSKNFSSTPPNTPEDRLPPALKHGGYSTLALLPGEDAEHFRDHVQQVFGEYRPAGPTEENLVHQIAILSWRAKNLDCFARAEKAKNDYARLLQYDERYKPEAAVMLNGLDAWKEAAEYLNVRASEKYRREKMDSDNALKKFAPLAVDVARALNFDIEAEAKKAETDIELARMSNDLTVDAMMKEIRIRDDLNASLLRLVKQLMIIKGSKQVIGLENNKSVVQSSEALSLIEVKKN